MLLVVTTSSSNSHISDQLRRTLPSEYLSVHLLRIQANTTLSPNAYLNLARFFSQTDRVVLFPLSSPPLLSHSDLYQVGAVDEDVLVLPKDHAVWCTERIFIDDSREAHWAACLWQFWLDSFGEGSFSRAPPQWDIPANTTKVRSPPPFFKLFYFIFDRRRIWFCNV